MYIFIQRYLKEEKSERERERYQKCNVLVYPEEAPEKILNVIGLQARKEGRVASQPASQPGIKLRKVIKQQQQQENTKGRNFHIWREKIEIKHTYSPLEHCMLAVCTVQLAIKVHQTLCN